VKKLPPHCRERPLWRSPWRPSTDVKWFCHQAGNGTAPVPYEDRIFSQLQVAARTSHGSNLASGGMPWRVKGAKRATTTGEPGVGAVKESRTVVGNARRGVPSWSHAALLESFPPVATRAGTAAGPYKGDSFAASENVPCDSSVEKLAFIRYLTINFNRGVVVALHLQQHN
jgi:hypothetical protein